VEDTGSDLCLIINGLTDGITGASSRVLILISDLY
jgi:hypothetical protein